MEKREDHFMGVDIPEIPGFENDKLLLVAKFLEFADASRNNPMLLSFNSFYEVLHNQANEAAGGINQRIKNEGLIVYDGTGYQFFVSDETEGKQSFVFTVKAIREDEYEILTDDGFVNTEGGLVKTAYLLYEMYINGNYLQVDDAFDAKH